MLTDLPASTGLIFAIAIAPGLVCWWQGRRLKRLADDPALPERLMAARQRNGAMLGACFVLLTAASVDALPWTVPLMVLSVVVASYPLRRALFAETWGLTAYVSFVMRLVVGVWGFWIALVMTPTVVDSAGSFGWLVAPASAAALVLWNARYATVLRFLLRTRPIENLALLSRFSELVQRSGISMPRFECVDLHGGAVANAIALPALGTSSVIFTQTLIERLQPEETAAICAHELAHLEYFNPQRLRRINSVNLLLIGSGAAVAPVSALIGLSSYLVALACWALGFVAAMAWRARDRQRNETASDLRAVALCGNAEALISGLTRLYTMARVPRRLDSVSEQRATHPSLARRIRDIRAAAGATGATLTAAATFTGTDGRSVVTFEHDTLRWTEGEAAVHSLNYAYLAELRLEVRGNRPASLIALERAGRRWELPLAADDLARAQAVLDVVDAQLPAPEGPRTVWPQISRTVLAFGALIGLLVGQLAMVFVTILALLQPAAPLLAAAAFASLAAAALLMRHGGFGGGASVELAVVLAAFGAALLWLARSKRGEEIPRRTAIPAGLLGLLAAVSVGALALGGFDPVRIHQSARSATAAPVLLVAFAGALSLWRSRSAQYAAIPVIVVAAATSAAASTTFLDHFGRDPFLVRTDPLVWRTVSGDTVAEFSVPFPAAALQLSPSGGSVAIVAEGGEHDERDPSTFHVGRAGSALTTLSADSLIFVDDEHILLMRSEGDGVELRHLSVTARDSIVWRTQISDIHSVELSYKAGTRRWRLMGLDRQRRTVRVDGVLGEATVRRTEWPASHAADGWIESVASSGGDAIFVQARYNSGFLQRRALWRWPWLFPPDRETRFRTVTDGTSADLAVSRLDAQCFASALSNDELLCSAFDGSRTRFIAIDPVSKRIAGVAWLHGRFAALDPSGEWLSGWRDGTPVALNLQQRVALQVPADCKDRVFQIASSERLTGTIEFGGTGSVVKLYKTD